MTVTKPSATGYSGYVYDSKPADQSAPVNPNPDANKTEEQTTGSSQESLTDTGSYVQSELEPTVVNFDAAKPAVRSLYRSSCITDAIEKATGLTGVKLDSGDTLSEATLKKITGKKWDGIDFSKYTDLNKLGSYFAEKGADGKLLLDADGKLTPKKDTIISDGAHVYVLKDFQYKLGENGKPLLKDGKPIITGFVVVDPATNEEKTITSKEIKSSRNFTAFVQERAGEKQVGDGNFSHKADGRMAGRYSDIASSKTLFNPIDKAVGSESQNIRLFFAALGDPRQKDNVAAIMKEINNMKPGSDGKFSPEDLQKLKTLISQKLNINIDTDELQEMAKIFTTDVSSMATSPSTKALIEKVKAAKAGGGDFGGYNKTYFKTSSGSPDGKVTVGDLFLYMQSEKAFSNLPKGVSVNADKTALVLPPGSNFDSTSGRVNIPTATSPPRDLKVGGTYLDPTTKEIYQVTSFSNDNPPKVNIKKLDGIGREEHNNYEMGIQFVNLSFENFGTDPTTSNSQKAKSLLENFDNLIHGREGC